MKPLRAPPLPLTLAGLALLSGCGDPLATGTYEPPYVTLQGAVSNQQRLDRVGVALLWQVAAKDTGESAFATQLGALSPEVGGYHLGVTALPPASVTWHTTDADALVLPPDLAWARGLVIAYRDDNGNGTFDIVPPDGHSPDEVLADAGFDVFYHVAGPLEPGLDDVVPTQPFFSVVSRNQMRDPEPGECDPIDAGGIKHLACAPVIAQQGATQPDASAVSLDLDLVSDDSDAHQRLQGYGCGNFFGTGDYADLAILGDADIGDGPSHRICEGYDCPPEMPPTDGSVVSLSCSSDGRAYVYKQRLSIAGYCGTAFFHYGHGRVRTSDPVPPDWPCVVPA